ncbi:MAG: hypothetical protein JWO36_3149 [Myxococcales bacterium]|nr:hypothetical protein [Myxococcales bacterium]
MLRWVVVVVWLAAGCKFHFDPRTSSDDAVTGDGSAAGDSPSGDGAGTDVAMHFGPVVQAVKFDTATGNFDINSTQGGLAPVTAGNMVLVVCGAPAGSGPCAPVSVPATTWLALDMGTALSVYVACSAPAITSIHLTNAGFGDAMGTVTEWSGVNVASCFDTKRTSTACPPAPSTWTSNSTPVVSQNRELILSVGEAGSPNAGWTIDPRYTLAIDATGVNGTADVQVSYRLVNVSPATYDATGTVNAWATSCYNDVIAIKTL